MSTATGAKRTWCSRCAPTIRADDPPGADTLIVIATTEKRLRIEGELAGIHDKHAPTALVDAISTHLGADDQIGIATYTTLKR